MLFILFIVLFTAEVWSLLLLNLEQKAIDTKVNNDIKAMEGNRSQQASQRAKRKSCTAVCYVEPGLRRYNAGLIPSSVNCSPLN